ncbi:MAG: MBL fold metallo-hydrolase [Patescibacteria group bacterium]
MTDKKSGELAITFYGGAGSVTGANFLFTSGAGRFLVDCGLFQGGKIFEDRNDDPFPYNPSEIDGLFVTHAHLDHVGRIPRLVRDGFHGPIYSTPPTKALAELILRDSMGVMAKEAKSSHRPLLYDEGNIVTAMGQWQTLDYHTPLKLGELTVTLRDAGHILGSSIVEFKIQGKKIVFTGDLGNSPAPLQAETEFITDADYLVMESVYGDRNHEDVKERRNKLEDIIENTMRLGGTLMIPAFSLERTQELLYEIEQMMAEGRIPSVPVYLDSPLAIQVTEIYKTYKDYFNERVADPDLIRDGLFNFPNLKKTLTTEESKAIPHAGRKVIIAGSGMSNGGRILHHEKRYLSDPKNALLLVGYQSVGSLGRLLQEGAKSVTILGEPIQVKAKVVNLSGYSAHRDSAGLLDFVAHGADSLKRVYLAMGEPAASLFLAQRIRDYLGVETMVPRSGDKFVLS